MNNTQGGPGDAALEDRGQGRFALRGVLNIETVPALWEASRLHFRAGEENLVVELGGVAQSDSAGLALLVGWKRWAHANNRSLQYTDPPGMLRVLAASNHLTDFLGMEDAAQTLC